jgi:hypothetical protein
VFEQRALNQVVQRLLADAALGVGPPHDDEPSFVGKTQVVMRDAIDDAVHRRRRADAQPERQAGDRDHGRMAAPEPQSVAHV